MQSLQEQPRMGWLIALILLNAQSGSLAETNPHQPYKQTWILTDGETHTTLNETTRTAPIGTWWPELQFCFRDINPAYKSTAPESARRYGFYACPGHKKNQECGGIQYSFCRSWACVTSNDSEWKWGISKSDLVKFAFVNGILRGHRIPIPTHKCQPTDLDRIKVTFTETGKKDTPGWIQGKVWGLVFYKYGGHAGSTIVVRLKIEPIGPPSTAVGPNKVLRPPNVKPSPQPSTTHHLPSTIARANVTTPRPSETSPPLVRPSLMTASKDPLWGLMGAAFLTLNHTNPNMTNSCWLCYDVRPPFYEAIGLNTTHDTSSEENPTQCSWGDRKRGLTIQQVNGQGTCLGKVPKNRRDLCTVINASSTWGNAIKWVIPKDNGWWLCSRSGLTPCLSTKVFNSSKEFCVIVVVLPRILYHSEESLYSYWNIGTGERKKREPISTLTIATLLSLGVAGAGTGIASLATQHKGMSSLRAAIDEDIERIETSISHLEKSLTSLSEVVLQNRRGLDLLFLQKGGLCVALGEECCFYADHTGVVRDSMSKLRKSLEQRKREKEAGESWFESWFNQSPWLATLLSALAGPIIIILLLVTIGPWILNRLMTFVKSRINTIQLLVLRQQYQALHPLEDDSSI
ncbi:protein C3orf33 homolog isoform X1 [Castor canadensis]|uniref:Protein C3orf33 homolog isoform X1 n=1 Tax=Castor canadensis TaxID=51338 RepID=A0AC58MKW6_CASCN